MKGFCDPMGQTRILWVHGARVCLGPKTITHLHLTIVALNYHFASIHAQVLPCLPVYRSTCTACPVALQHLIEIPSFTPVSQHVILSL